MRRASPHTEAEPEGFLGGLYLDTILDHLLTFLGSHARNGDSDELSSDQLSIWAIHHGLMVISNTQFFLAFLL